MSNPIKISIIYPVEPSYIIGLLSGLSKINDIKVDFLGSDRSIIIKNKYPNIKFINIRGSQNENAPLLLKFIRIIRFYFRLILYCLTTDLNIYHSHFPNKILFIDYIIINIILKIRNKKILHTAHNIDFNRDNKQNIYREFILKLHYKLVDAIIVHNRYSFEKLISKFPYTKNKTYITRIGINSSSTKSDMTKYEARKLLGIPLSAKTILFFGGINPYKGLEILIRAFSELLKFDSNYILIIAGSPRDKEYFKSITFQINKLGIKNFIKEYYDFIPDNEVEKFFKASDCCVLPYKSIFQSGVHVLSYSFGLPVIASNIGSFKKEDIIEGKTGFIFESGNYIDLKQKLELFFASDLYSKFEKVQKEIVKWAYEYYSWDNIAKLTMDIYIKTIKQN